MKNITNYVEVNLDNIKHNLNIIRKKIGSNVFILPILKGDAYGHGLIEVAKVLEKEDIYGLGVASIKEGVCLRRNGIKKRIILLGGFLEEDIYDIVEYDLIPSIYDYDLVEKINYIAKENKKIINAHIRIDTGMGTIGILTEKALDFILGLSEFKYVYVEGIYTQIASSYSANEYNIINQLNKFNKCIDLLLNKGIDIKIKHVANSYMLYNHEEAHLDMVRPGIILYGMPIDENENIFKPVMQIKSKVVHIKKISKDSNFCYENNELDRDCDVAIIPIGYGDALFLYFLKKGEVLIGGKRFNILGNICMDQFIVDISGDSDIKIGDEVVIIGEQEGDILSYGDVVKKCNFNTINCELLSYSSKRLTKIFRGDEIY